MANGRTGMGHIMLHLPGSLCVKNKEVSAALKGSREGEGGAPNDYTEPRQTIQSPARLYKPKEDYTELINIRQKPEFLDKDRNHLTNVKTNINLTSNIVYLESRTTVINKNVYQSHRLNCSSALGSASSALGRVSSALERAPSAVSQGLSALQARSSALLALGHAPSALERA